MSRRLPTALSVLVAILVPPLLVLTSLRIVANDWIVHFEYRWGGVPADRYGLTRGERTDLALTGLRSILPGGEGVALLRNARLPEGGPAFNEREIGHMEDVRTLVGVAFRVHLAALLALAALALALAVRPARRAIVPTGLRFGAAATLAVATLVGLYMLVGWGSFFTRFHEVFFEGESWRFPTSDTLIRLYPDELWIGVAAFIAGGTVVLAALLAVAGTLWLRVVRGTPDKERGGVPLNPMRPS